VNGRSLKVIFGKINAWKFDKMDKVWPNKEMKGWKELNGVLN